MRGDWKDQAMQYRDIDRAAQEKAEAEIAAEERAKRVYQDAITGTNPQATKKLIKGLRRAWKMDEKL